MPTLILLRVGTESGVRCGNCAIKLPWFYQFFFSCFCQAHEAHRFSLCAHSRAPLHRKYRWNAVSKFKLASPGRPERKVGRIQTPAWAKSGTKLTLDPPSNPYCPAPALVSQHGCFSNSCFGASLTYPPSLLGSGKCRH